VRPSELADRLRAERAGAPFLLHLDGEGRQRIVDLDAVLVSIGRQVTADVPLTWDSEVSRLHAVLERVSGEWTLCDDGLSRNGSFVNGERVSGRRVLADGDAITVGRTLIVYRSGPPAEPAETTRATTHLTPPDLTRAQLRVLEALCDPGYGAPPSNRELAETLFLSVDTVKSHLRELFHAFNVPDLPQNRKRAELARRAHELGLVRRR
jgi:pSer/pThr/pTyr-binding forkhead associated (FHA) protein